MSLLVRQLNERLAETQARLAAAERVVEAARAMWEAYDDWYPVSEGSVAAKLRDELARYEKPPVEPTFVVKKLVGVMPHQHDAACPYPAEDHVNAEKAYSAHANEQSAESGQMLTKESTENLNSAKREGE